MKMIQLIDKEMISLFGVCLSFSIIGFWLLANSEKTSIKWVRKLLYVPARKSKTNALQLGGFPLAMSVITCMIGYLFVFDDSLYFPPIDRSILKVWIVSSLGIVTYGYLDDRYEFRPIVKLSSQFMSIFIFAFFSSALFLSMDSRISFIVSFCASIVIINGSNLLDGLDTLTVKNSLAILGMYFLIGAVSHSYPIVMISLLMIIPISVFWYYNREPSRIHLGEIGGTFIGFSYILLSSLSYKWLTYNHDISLAICLSFIPISHPIVEVIVSVFRRLYNKKSPMSGDKLHIHHILNSYKKYSHSTSASLIGTSNLILMAGGIAIAINIHPVLGLLFTICAQILCMYFVGKNYWFASGSVEIKPKKVFDNLRKKDITVIETSDVERFKLTILNPKKSREEDAS